MKQYFKDFEAWNRKKKALDERMDAPSFSEREVWWASVGVNIGNEQDGKNESFNRPVLILRKFSKYLCMAIPISSVMKRGHFFFPVSGYGFSGVALLSQQRVLSAKRLERKIGRLDPQAFVSLKQAIVALYDE